LWQAGNGTYVYVKSMPGAMLAQDDDGGNGTNSRLVFRPQRSGQYQIFVTSYGRGTGDYVLSVRR
jgi:hypothetical protein